MRDPIIEAAARAIRQVVADRVGSKAIAWDDLEAFHREAYRAEAAAAISAAKAAYFSVPPIMVGSVANEMNSREKKP